MIENNFETKSSFQVFMDFQEKQCWHGSINNVHIQFGMLPVNLVRLSKKRLNETYSKLLSIKTFVSRTSYSEWSDKMIIYHHGFSLEYSIRKV
jgi:hypothetical protein